MKLKGFAKISFVICCEHAQLRRRVREAPTGSRIDLLIRQQCLLPYRVVVCCPGRVLVCVIFAGRVFLVCSIRSSWCLLYDDERRHVHLQKKAQSRYVN